MNVLLIVLCHTRPTYTPGPMDDLATPIFLLQSPLQRRAVQPWQQRLDPYAEPMPQQRPACFCRVTALSAHRMDRYNSAARLNQACCDGAAATRSRCQQRSPHVPPVKAAAQTPANQVWRPLSSMAAPAPPSVTTRSDLQWTQLKRATRPFAQLTRSFVLVTLRRDFQGECTSPFVLVTHADHCMWRAYRPWVLVIIFEIRVTSLRWLT